MGIGEDEDRVIGTLLEAVRDLPSLWKKSDPGYHDKQVKQNCWETVQERLKYLYPEDLLARTKCLEIEDIKKRFVLKRQAYSNGLNAGKKRKSGMSRSEYELSKIVGDPRIRFLSENHFGKGGHSNLTPPAPAQTPKRYHLRATLTITSSQAASDTGVFELPVEVLSNGGTKFPLSSVFGNPPGHLLAEGYEG